LLDNQMYSDEKLATLRATIQNKNVFKINRVGGLLYIKFKIRNEDNWCEVSSEDDDDTDDAIISRVEAEILHYLITKNNRRNGAIINQIDSDITSSDYVKNAPMPKKLHPNTEPHNEENDYDKKHELNRHSRSYSMMTSLSGLSDYSDIKTKNTLGYTYDGTHDGTHDDSHDITHDHMFGCIRNKIITSMKEMMNTPINEIDEALKKINGLRLYISTQRHIQKSTQTTVNLFHTIKTNVIRFNEILNVYKDINVVPYKRLLKKTLYELCYMDDMKITGIDVYFLIDLTTSEISFTKKNDINIIHLWNTLIDIDYIIDDID